MKLRTPLLVLSAIACATGLVVAQGDSQGPPLGPPPGQFPGQRGQGGPGGGGPGSQPEVKLVAKFDANKDGWLNKEERALAREEVQTNRPQGGRGGGFGRGGRGNATPPSAGKTLSPNAVPVGGDKPLYDRGTLRTVFLEFENEDWEKELEAFHNTDVEVPATLTIDRKVFKNVGVSFRGASSYMMVPTGYKRSFNISVDMADAKQRVLGYKTLNLLNSNGDPTFFRTMLYSQIAEQYLPVPKVNLVRVAVNGENWGVYVNSQQFNKEFLAEHHQDANGTRWKAPGRPNGNSGLNYLGDDPEAYQRLYEIKTDNEKEAEAAWKALIRLCKTLEQTPVAQLERALEPMLDLDEVIHFLALENALVNSDGYWTRASDYSLFLDSKGKFHIVPHDINEAMSSGGRGGPGGPPPGGFGGPPPSGFPPQGGPPQGGPPFGGRPQGGRGGPGGGGPNLDPFVAINQANKPLISKLLAVPSLRTRYLKALESIAKNHLQWSWIEPLAQAHHRLVGAEVEADTKKSTSFEAYMAGLGLNGGGLRQFVEQRSAYLLAHPEIRSAR